MLTKKERSEKTWEVYKSLYIEQTKILYTSGVNGADLSEETKDEISESLYMAAKRMVSMFDKLDN